MRLVDRIADDEKSFYSWCERNNHKVTNWRCFYDDPLYKDYEDFLDPPEERKKREEKHSLYKNTFKTMVGVLTLDTWYGANQSKEKCPKCKTHMIYKYGFLLSDEYGCPGCGHTEGGEW